MVLGPDRNLVSIQGEANDEINDFGIDCNWLFKPNLAVVVLDHKELHRFFFESSKFVDNMCVEVGLNSCRRDVSCVIYLRLISHFGPVLRPIVFI